MHTFNRTQLKRIKKVLNGQSIKTLKDPFERHQLLLHWNFDDGLEPLEYLVDQPDTDLGTIVLLYWLLGPGALYKVAEKDEAFSLLKKIEENVAKDFYVPKKIAIDPANNMGSNFLIETDNKTILTQIPKVLTQTTPGDTMEMVELEIKYVFKVYPLTDDDRKKLSDQIDKGIELLKEVNPDITRESDPQAIIDAMDIYSKKRRPTVEYTETKFDRKQTNNFKYLDKVFGEQLVRKADWKWYIHEEHEQVLDYRDLVVISADKNYEWHFFMTSEILGYSNRMYSEGIGVKNAFDNLMDIEKYVQRKIKDKFDFHRRTKPEFKNKSDGEIIKLITSERVLSYRNNPNIKDKYQDVSDAEIISKQKHFLDSIIYGHLLPTNVSGFAIFRKHYDFEEEK